jgi:DNA-nicking Smr family endonuclease
MKVRQLTDISALNAAKKLARVAADPPADVEKSAEPSFSELMAPELHKPRPATPDDSADSTLFRSLMGAVQPLLTRASAQVERPPQPLPDAKMSRADEVHVIEELAALPDDVNRLDGADQMSYLADGHSPKLLRKLKRAQFRINDELDLHFEKQATAAKMLHSLLNQARANDQLCLLVVHGKGRHSGEAGAALKNMVDVELRRRKDVLAFCSAPPGLGGTGAVLVLLKS